MANLPVPTPQQAAWQDLEVGMFIHLDMFTFHPGWNPYDDPSLLSTVPPAETFNPVALDTDQWMEAARAFGARYAVLTVKHSSGFCLWPTDLYPYSVKQSPWRGGKGDIVGDFVASCHKYDIKPGIYCSFPSNWYLNFNASSALSGDPQDQAHYAEVYGQMLREVWSRYGALTEVWFDGGLRPADDGGLDVGPLLAELQPDAVVFQSPHASIRWVGTETGRALDPCWSTIAAGGTDTYGAGDPDGTVWCPGETDTTLLPSNFAHGGWFWVPGCERMMRPLDELMDVYRTSVGRNTNLILNSSPGPDGLIPDAHMIRYRELGREINRTFSAPAAQTQGEGDIIELHLPEPTSVNHVTLMEDITQGERVRSYIVEFMQRDHWDWVVKGTCIGHKRIHHFDSLIAQDFRLRITESVATPQIKSFAVFPS